MVPQILFRLAPGTTVRGVTWDSGSNATNLRFLGCIGNQVQFRVRGNTVFGFNTAPLPPGTVLYIPIYQVQAVAL